VASRSSVLVARAGGAFGTAHEQRVRVRLRVSRSLARPLSEFAQRPTYVGSTPAGGAIHPIRCRLVASRAVPDRDENAVFSLENLSGDVQGRLICAWHIGEYILGVLQGYEGTEALYDADTYRGVDSRREPDREAVQAV